MWYWYTAVVQLQYKEKTVQYELTDYLPITIDVYKIVIDVKSYVFVFFNLGLKRLKLVRNVAPIRTETIS